MWPSLCSTFHRHLVPIKYVGASVSVYAYLSVAAYSLVELFKFDEVIAYIAAYTTAYIIEYTITLGLVFTTEHRWSKTAKYVVYVAAFLLFSTSFFKFLLSVNLHYLWATLLTSIALMPIRFMINKHWVYR